MKKSFLLILLVLFLITGCGKEEKVSCSKTISYDEYGSISDKVESTFKNNHLNNIVIERSFNFHNEDLVEENKEIVDMVALSYEAYGYDAEVLVNGKTILLTAKANVGDIIHSDNESVLKVNEETTKEEFINIMSEDDYTCK